LQNVEVFIWEKPEPIGDYWRRVFSSQKVFHINIPAKPEPIVAYWLRLFSIQNFSRTNTPTFSNLVILHTYPPINMEQTECSETSAYKIQTPGNYPGESIK